MDTLETEQEGNRGRIKTMRKKNLSLCTEDILKLVARGSAIICEILRLKDYIPEPYTNKNDEKLYKDIIFDYSILKGDSFQKFENKLASDQELSDKDENFRVEYIDVIERFYLLFNSINQYITDWKTLISNINGGFFVQHTLDSILQTKDIRPLLCESIFNAGVMLLLVDRLIPGPIREKLIVSYYRYKGKTTIDKFQEVYTLFKRTEYLPPTSFSDPKDEVRPKKYPVDFFGRCKFDESIISKIIVTISRNDIYEQQLAYVNTDYQSIAFSQQASLLVVILFFCPDFLEKDQRNMYDLTRKHFDDNFVVSFYMGYTIDINEYWKDFKEAHNSLELYMKTSDLKNKKNEQSSKIQKLDGQIKEYLKEGAMNEETVLTRTELLLNIMRDSNVVLRWFILQRNITKKSIREIFNDKLENNEIVNLLLNLSQFEYSLKTMYEQLVKNKESMWNDDKNLCMEKCNELIQHYSGNTAFSQNQKDEGCIALFEDLNKKLSMLDTKNITKASTRIGKIKDIIRNIQSLEKITAFVNAKENLKRINKNLDHMLLILNINKKNLSSMSKISDFSYAWICIHDYKNEMQRLLSVNPKNVLLLRATFLKLASILNFPLIRLFEIESEDIESVTDYYSGELVRFVKTILQVIPRRVFQLMNNIIKIFDKGFLETPIQIKKVDLKDYAQSNLRFELARNVHGISMITKGIFLMEKTLLGITEVDPKELLEEGIRKELLNLLANTFQNNIDFSPGDKIDINEKLNQLINEVKKIRKSFLYIQDYVNINGSKMWSEEMHRLINYYVELEANKFLTKKIKHKDDKYEIFKYKIPRFQPLKNSPECFTFLGRLVRFILLLTDQKNTTFCPSNYTWYEKEKIDKEIFGIKTLYKVKKAIGVEGFQGFTKLLGYLNSQNLLQLQHVFNNKLFNESNGTLRVINRQIGVPFISHTIQKSEGKEIINNMKKYNKKVIETVMEKTLKIGQIELFRKICNFMISENSEVDCSIINTEMKSIDKINLLILKNDMKVNFQIDDANANNNVNVGNAQGNDPNKKQENPSLDNYYNNLCSFLEDFGYIDSEHTYFQNLNSLEYMPIILATTTYNTLKDYFDYDKKKLIIEKKMAENFDMYYYTSGLHCILYQMGKKKLITFIAILCAIIRFKLIRKKDKKDKKEKKKDSSSLGDSNPEKTKYVSLLQYVLQEIADNVGINLDYFEINLNSYFLFKNVATYHKVEPKKKKNK